MLEADLLRAALFLPMLLSAVLIGRRRRYAVGRMLILIGTLHMTGLWVGRAAVARIIAGGIFNQADSGVGHVLEKADQELVFWFALWGLWTVMIGQLALVLERRGAGLPSWFGWQLLVVNLACGVMIPKAGFWWVLLPAWWIIRGHAGPAVPSAESNR